MSIEIRNVSKNYGGVQALQNVNLTLGENKIYGLLGSNGAGKSTLINLITDRQLADAGEILVEGESVRNNDAALGKILAVGEANFFPEDFKVKEAFDTAARFYPGFCRARAEELAGRFGLNTKRKIKALSTGYGSIFRLILGLSTQVPYLFFDEPVLGLDARHRDLFYRLLMEKYAENPCTIVISTHLIAEVANLIEHTVILHKGRVLKDCPSEELRGEAYSVSGPASLVEGYIKGKTVLSMNALGGLRTACLQGKPEKDLPAGLEYSPLSLQDYFISLMEEEEKA